MPRRSVALMVGLGLALAGSAVLVTADGNAGGYYTITADVEQAPALFENGRVMVRGVEVGTITGVEPRSGGVRLTLSVSEDVKLPADAHLSVVPITVIADRYVQITPPYSGGDVMVEGDHIAVEDTTIPAELDDVLAQLKGLLSALEPRHGQRGPLAALIENLDDAVKGRAGEIAGTLEGGAEVLGNLAASDLQITQLIENLDRVFLTLADRSSEIGLINERLAIVAEALASDRENLAGTLENIAFLSTQGSALVSESGDELGVALDRLDTVLTTVLEHEDSLAEGMRWTNVIAQGLGATDASGRGLYAYTGRQTAPGSARSSYNYRIDTRDTIACGRIQILTDSFKEINPDWGFAEVRHAILSYIPDIYHDDLDYLIDLLIPLCTDLENTATLSERADRVLEAVARGLPPRRRAALGASGVGP